MPKYIDFDKIPFSFVHGRWDDLYASKSEVMQLPEEDVLKIEWISVSEGLPDLYQPVLIKSEYGTITVAFREKYANGNWGWVEVMNEKTIDDINIVKWMDISKLEDWL